jgi:hypothetical protein
MISETREASFTEVNKWDKNRPNLASPSVNNGENVGDNKYDEPSYNHSSNHKSNGIQMRFNTDYDMIWYGGRWQSIPVTYRQYNQGISRVVDQHMGTVAKQISLLVDDELNLAYPTIINQFIENVLAM